LARHLLKASHIAYEEVNMDEQDLEQEIARLESVNDHLRTEIEYIDELLRQSGFTRGLESLKEVAQEMIQSPDFEMGE
jgi:hypothetical protein